MSSTSDPVGLALASIGAGASAGASVITAGMALLRSVQAGQPDGDVDAAFAMMSVALFAGLAVAVSVGVTLTQALEESWRRGAVGAIALFGAALLAGISAPADMVAGRVGILSYLILLVVLFVVTLRAARRSAVA